MLATESFYVIERLLPMCTYSIYEYVWYAYIYTTTDITSSKNVFGAIENGVFYSYKNFFAV